MLGRIKETVGDVAETIKRAFAGPKVYTAPHFFVTEPTCQIIELPATGAVSAQLLAQMPSISVTSLLLSSSVISPCVGFQAKVFQETGEVFKADAKLVSIKLVWTGVVKSAGIPKMNTPAVERLENTMLNFNTISHALIQYSLKPRRTFKLSPTVFAPQCFVALKVALLRPISVRSEDIEKISKALLMRYTLQLVKESGENARNLEIIGIFRIPKNGVRSVKHDGFTGALRVTVGPEAQNSSYCKLILARKKNNSGMVNCTVDE